MSGDEGVEWPALDIQAHVPGLLLAVAGKEDWQRRLFASERASLAGSAKTDAKTVAARANSAKGGRWRKAPFAEPSAGVRVRES